MIIKGMWSVAVAVTLAVGVRAETGPGAAGRRGEPPLPVDSWQVHTIPWGQLGAKAAQQYTGDGLSVTATSAGAKLRCIFHKMAGEASSHGLWLTSAVKEGAGERFRVRAVAYGRMDSAMTVLSETGAVRVAEGVVRWERPQLAEEYSVSMDGVRQDFIVADPPVGEGALRVLLDADGALIAAAPYGVTLTLDESARAIAYSRLRVTDATGRELSGRMEIANGRLAVVVEDARAAYPIRIDPTFSDVNWVCMNPSYPGANGSVYASCVDATGNLYVGGSFTIAGGLVTRNVAKWDGGSWRALGTGTDSTVYTLTTDSSGNVYAGGSFTNAGGVLVKAVAKWDGTVWSALGSGMAGGPTTCVYDLVADTAGGLYAGGSFTLAGGVVVNRIAKWNGSVWSALGSGMDNTVLCVALDGNGSLFAGGNFTTSGGTAASRVSKWNGSAWSALGSGVSSSVQTLATDGAGNLYVGGSFTTAGGTGASRIAKWNGSAWSALGSGFNDSVYSLAVDEDGTLYAGGIFTTAGGVTANRVAKWNGSAWSALGSGFNSYVRSLAVDNNGSLYAGGTFTPSGGVNAYRIAKWNGSSWSVPGVGIDGNLWAMASDRVGNLYIGGSFITAGGVIANRIAKWDGKAWSVLGTGFNSTVFSLATDPNGDLYAGGVFTTAGGVGANHIAKWNGSAWSALGAGVNDNVRSLAVDTGGIVYAGGDFTSAGGIAANRVAKWNGSTWSALGAGFSYRVNVLRLAADNTLYAGFSGSSTSVAKWDGSAWSTVGSSIVGNVLALVIDQAGFLYAGGPFGGYVAKLNGSKWTTFGSGFDAQVNSLALDSSGKLFAGGTFTTVNGASANHVARWNGSSWMTVGTGVDGTVNSLVVDTQERLLVGGDFTVAGGQVSPYFAVVKPATDVIVEQPVGHVLADGGATVDFGRTAKGVCTDQATFIVRCVGESALRVGSLVVTGAHADDFHVSTNELSRLVMPNGSTSFAVAFLPSEIGTRSATLSITNNSINAPSFAITLTGEGAPRFTLAYAPGQGGSISGDVAQVVLAGDDGSTVTAVPDPGFSFVRWSDGVITASRKETNVLTNIAVTAHFEALPPTMTSEDILPTGRVSVAYSHSFSATGGTTPYVWSVSAGVVPSGLSLGTNGVIGGTPVAVGTAVFTVRVTGGNTLFSEKAVSLTIGPAPVPPVITVTSPLPQVALDKSYIQPLTATGGAPPYAWSIVTGALPPGLSLDSAGSLSGTSAGKGLFIFDVRVLDAYGLAATQTMSLTVFSGLGAYAWTNYVGKAGGEGNVDGANNAARFAYPAAVAADPDGNIFVADQSNHTIRKICPTGSVSTLAGVSGVAGYSDGSDGARFYSPGGIARSTNGFLYVVDRDAHTIRQVTPSGTVTTFAGLAAASGSANGTNSAARFYYPRGIAADGAGNLYVADTYNHTVRKIAPDGTVTTLAGSAGASGSANGTGIAARFYYPYGVAVDSAGYAYVADTYNHTVRKISPAGLVTTLAGTAGAAGNTDGTGGAARFSTPQGIAVDADGNVYVADRDYCTVRKITPAGVVTTLAGDSGYYGSSDGTGTAALFQYPSGLSVDGGGDILVADQDNHTIRRIAAAGVVTTVAGVPSGRGRWNGTGEGARFNYPRGVAVDGSGTAYVADSENHTIRKVTPPGVVTTFAGLAGTSGVADGTNSAARFYTPQGLAADVSNNLYVADYKNHTVRKITPDGTVTTLAGSAGTSGSANGTGGAARFNNPWGVAVDLSGTVYVADRGNHAIRKITSAGVVTTLAGAAGTAGSADGTGTAATFNTPMGVAVDASGTVYVADSWNHTIRRITPAGVVTTLAGAAGSRGNADGVGTMARFNNPIGLRSDTLGNLFISDYANHTVRRITPDGVVSTVGGLAGTSTAADGAADRARFSCPAAVGADLSGNLYLADSANNRISKGLFFYLPELVNAESVTNVMAGTAYYVALAAGGGAGPYTYAVVGGSLPSGVTLSADGILSGAPDLAGTYAFRIRVTGGGGYYSEPVITLTVDPMPGMPDAEYVWATFVGSTSGVGGNVDGIGTAARFNGASGVALDSAGTLYVADRYNNTIRKVTTNGVVTTLAGSGAGYTNGTGSAACFNGPRGLAMGVDGNLYVADRNNSLIRKVTPAGVVSLFAGKPGYMGYGNGTGSAATFTGPEGIAADAAGNFYVADTLNQSIRKITASAAVSLLAGDPTIRDENFYAIGSYADGTGTAARFNDPSGVAADAAGNVYVADAYNHVIRKVTAAGAVTTLAGLAGISGSADGTNSTARFNLPSGIAFDPSGNLIVGDTGNLRVRRMTPDGKVSTIGGPENFSYPQGVVVDAQGKIYVADSGRITVGTPRYPPALVTESALPPGVVGQPYNQTLTAVGGKRPITWSRTAGVLPAGLSLSSDGVLSGTPTATAAVTFTLKATGSDGGSTSKTFTLSILGITTVTPLRGGTVGYAYSASLAATNGMAPYTWSLADGVLPGGLTLDSGGTISGTPTVPVSAVFTVRVVDGNGLACAKAFALAVSALPEIVTPSPLPGGNCFVAYSQTLAVTNGTAPFTWTLQSGTLPAGLSLGTSGTLSGTPTEMGTMTFTAQIVDSYGAADSRAFSLTIGAPAPLVFTTSQTLPDGSLGAAYSQTLAVSGGAPPLSWSLVSGTLPTGLSLGSAGSISGTPAAVGAWSFTLQVSAANGARSMRAFSLSIRAAPPVITGLSSSSTLVPGSSYTAALNASYGTQPYVWSLVSNSLPLGLCLSSSGVISGVLVRPETATFCVRCTGSDALFSEQELSLIVENPAYNWQTLAGVAGYLGSINGTGSVARFYRPSSIAVDGSGIVYVADTYNHTIRKVSPAGEVSTLAGTAGYSGSTNGTGSEARFYRPAGIAVDGSGNVFVADTSNHTVRKVTPDGQVSTFAGTAGSSGSANGMGSAARFNSPSGMAVDGSGNVFVADSSNHTIRKITPAGQVTTLAGTAGSSGSTDGMGSAARFNRPTGVAVDGSGNVFVADSYNHTIRKITPSGDVTTFAGKATTAGRVDAPGGDARFNRPTGVAVDGSGSVYVADNYNHTVRKITPEGVVTTLAGTTRSSGSTDGLGALARFYNPNSIAVDGSGNLYVADTYNHTIRKGTDLYEPVVLTSTLLPDVMVGESYGMNLAAAGGTPPYTWALTSGILPEGLALGANGVISGIPDVAVSATFSVRVTDTQGLSGTKDFTLNVLPLAAPSIASSSLPNGTCFVAYSQTLNASGGVMPFSWSIVAGRLPEGWTLSAGGVISGTPQVIGVGSITIRVTGGNGLFSDREFAWSVENGFLWKTLAGSSGFSGSTNATGVAARFSQPQGVAVDGAGNVYVADTYNHTIRKVTPSGEVTTLAGMAGTSGSADGSGSAARFSYPQGVGVDGSGNVFVADTANYTVRRVTPTGVVTTLAGLAGSSGSTDGTGSVARFNFPYGAVVDVSNNVYVADYGNNTIRKVTPSGEVTTLAGMAGSSGSADGTGSAARFNNPWGVAADENGNVYVADFRNGTIRKVTAAGVVTTLAGTAGSSGSTDGTGSAARFFQPTGVAVDSSGNIYVSDNNNHTIRKVTAAGVVTTLAGTAGSSGSTDGTGSAAKFRSPRGVGVDSSGNIYVADTDNHTIRKGVPIRALTVVTPSPLTGGTWGDTYSVSLATLGGEFPFTWTLKSGSLPAGVTLGTNGVISGTPTEVTTNNFVVQVTDAKGATATANLALTIAPSAAPAITSVSLPGGTAWTAYSQNLSATGGVTPYLWSIASGSLPLGLSLSTSGQISGVPRVFGTGSVTVRVTGGNGLSSEKAVLWSLTPLSYQWTTFAGAGRASGSADGTGSVARFYYPHGAAVDGSGNIYVADSSNHTIRKVTPEGVVTTLAGSTGISGNADGVGSAARFNIPFGVAVDGAGNVYVADTVNQTVRKVTPAGVVTTLAGMAGAFGSDDGMGSAARFNEPLGLAVDGSGSVYVADSINCTIRKVTSAGVVTTLAGTARSPGNADGTGSAARFRDPHGVAVDSANNVYVADYHNNSIRKVTPDGVVTTLAGGFNEPSGVAVDSIGNLFVADSYNFTVREVTADATVTTLGGLSGSAGYSDGLGSAARFSDVSGVAVNDAGTVYVVDSDSHCIRKGVPVTGLMITNSATLATGTVGANYVSQLGAVAGITPFAWSLESGTLPLGLSIGSTGLIAGEAAVAGTYAFTVRVTDAEGTSATQAFSLTVNPFLVNGVSVGLPVILSDTQLPSAQAGTSYSASLQVTNGTPAYAWVLASGTLPAGLTLSGDGVISGTPTVGGVTNRFIVQVNDSLGLSNVKCVELAVAASAVSRTPYETWKANRFTAAELGDAGICGDKADPDHDGIDNLLEYAYGLPPKTPDNAGLPVVSPKNGYFTLTYRQNKEATDLLYILEACDDLAKGAWTPVGLVEQSREDKGAYLQVVVRDAVPMSAAPRRFIRIRVIIKGSAFSAWQSSRFTQAELADTVISGYEADPDGDGLSNLEEYGFCLSPATPDTTGHPFGKALDGYFTLTFRQSKQSADLIRVVEACTDLTSGDWTTVGLTESSREDKGDHWLVTVKDSILMSEAPRRFLRLRTILHK